MLWNLNRYSFLITALLAIGGVGAAAMRINRLTAPIAMAGAGLAMVAVQRTLRNGPSSLRSWQQVEQALGGGTPTLLFVYSDT